MYEAVVRLSAWEVDSRIFRWGGDDGRVGDDAIDPYQWAVVVIAYRARLGDRRWERSILGAGHDHPVWAEVDEAGLEEKGPVRATRGGACGIAGVRQFLGEVHAKAARLRLFACIETDVPPTLQPRRSLPVSLSDR